MRQFAIELIKWIINNGPMVNQASLRDPGRPGGAGPDLAGKILDAAEGLFAEQGYGCTPIKAIAEGAGVNPALVHYYFGSKRDLLLAVMERAFQPLAGRLRELGDGDEVTLDDLLDVLIAIGSEHPRLPWLIAREVMLPGGEFQDFFVENWAPLLGGAIPGLISRAQARGEIAEDVDPVLATLSMLGLTVFPFIARDMVQRGLGLELTPPAIRSLRDQVRRTLHRGWQP